MAEEENVEKIPSNEKPKSHVVEGATLKCSCGDEECNLKIPNRKSILIQGKQQANIMDFKPMVNIPSFGKCRSLTNPTVAAATAANDGRLKKMPCIPNVTMPWIFGKEDMLVDGAPALLDCSKHVCIWGGKISIEKDGQREVDWDRAGEGLTKVLSGGLSCFIAASALKLAIAVGGVIAGGVSLPILLVAGCVAAAGVATVALCGTTGLSNVAEGAQDIFRGLSGNEKESRNPVKEKIGPEAYHNAELIGTMVGACALATAPYLAPFMIADGTNKVASKAVMDQTASTQTKATGDTAAGKLKIARGWGKSTTSALKLKSGKIDAVGQTKAAGNTGTRPAPNPNFKPKKFYRSMSERRKALLRDADDPNSGLSQEARDFIKKTNGKKVPERYEVSHKKPLYTEKIIEKKKKLDVVDNMETIPKKAHRDTHITCGETYHLYPPSKYK
ncbi:MAG: DUF4280 domain-containing protein [Firmicutes bacterium]|nr:DUF4280 domain-containing protein [Bacillota bacterium]